MFSQYLLLPTKFTFSKVVRIYSIICCFVSKARKNRKMLGSLLCESKLSFSVFFSTAESNLVSYFAKWILHNHGSQELFLSFHVDRAIDPVETDKYVNMALLYLFRKASLEVRKFNSDSVIKKHMIEKDDILLSKSRMVAGLDYVHTGELNLNLGSLGLKVNSPVVDRFSPLAYSIAQHVHWELAPHRGMEMHNRISLEHVYILQSMSLYKELSLECIRCNMRRKRFIEAEMGGVRPEQLTVAPPFWSCQIDLFGPYRIFVPGYERQTRNRKMLDCQVWILAIVCPTTRLVNLQVVEKTDAGGIICGLTRLACEVGMPKYVLCDQDSGIMAALSNADVTLRDLKLRLYKEKEIVFSTCPVGGHHQHGQVERVIRSIQQGLEDCGLKQERLHATGLQTLCKCVENSYNSVPIGYSYSRDMDNADVLKIITPNMLRMGRTNQRQLEGPIRLAKGTKELLDKIDSLYRVWFNMWRDTVVPKIMFRPKWYDSSKDLEIGDLVYFQKEDSPLDKNWIMGMVEQIVRSRDQVIRRVVVKYQNREEDFPRFTDRTVHKLVKLFNVDEHQVQEDLGELQKVIDALQGNPSVDAPADPNSDPDNLLHDDPDLLDSNNGEDAIAQPGTNDNDTSVLDLDSQDIDTRNDLGDASNGSRDVTGPAANTRSKRKRCNGCCCENHCAVEIHTSSFGRVPHPSCLVPCVLDVQWKEDLWKKLDLVEEEDEDEDLETSVLLSLNLSML